MVIGLERNTVGATAQKLNLLKTDRLCLTSCSFTLKRSCRIRIEACTLHALLKKNEWKLLYDVPFRFMELIYLVICSKPCLIIIVDMPRSLILSKNLEMAQ